MGIDVINLFRVDARQSERLLQSVSQGQAIGRQPCHVVCVAEAGESQDIAQNFRSALAGVSCDSNTSTPQPSASRKPSRSRQKAWKLW